MRPAGNELKVAEENAVNFENSVRMKTGDDMRLDYSGAVVRLKKHVIDFYKANHDKCRFR